MSDAYDPTAHIHVSVKSIEQHFTGEFTFHLPWFQRAYAWSEEHATQLLRDIIDASNNDRGRYFLGNVMLAVRKGQTAAALIDGHQRTLTLTILFALLRDRIDDPDTQNLLDTLIQSIPGQPNATAAGVRITPQPTNIECFWQYVQCRGSTLIEPDDNLHDFLESERNFFLNRNRMAEIIDEHVATDEAKIPTDQFPAEKLLNRCPNRRR